MTRPTIGLDEVRPFLFREADYLDAFRLEEWLDLLTDGFTFRVPVRITRARGETQSEFSDDSFIFDDDKKILSSRVDRLDKEYAWAENPQYRTRHMVSNVRIVDPDEVEVPVREGEVPVTSNVLLAYSTGDQDGRFLTAKRQDVVRNPPSNGELRLARRRVLLDRSVTESIPRFL